MADQNNEINTKVGVDTKDAEKKIKDFGKNASKSMDDVSESTKKIGNSSSSAKKGLEKLDGATGGLISSFKALALSPVGAVILALGAAFKLVTESIGRSESASKSFEVIGSKLSGLFNGLIAVITPVVELLGEALVFAIEKPEEAWNSFTDTIMSGYQLIKEQVFDRYAAVFGILVGKFQQGVLKMRIAWNEFSGDSEEVAQLTEELKKVDKSVENSTKILKQRNEELKEGFNKLIDGAKKIGDSIVENFNKAADATVNLAGAEKQLARNRIALEKQQLTSLRLAEEERQIRDDASKSIEERIEANKRLGAILDEQSKREIELANQNLNFARLQAQATGNTIENIEAIGDAEIKLLEIRERITGQRSEQLVNENSLLQEQKDAKQAEAEAEELKEEERLAKEAEQAEIDAENLLRDQEAQLELDEIELERLRQKGEATLEQELELLERKRLQDVSSEGLRLSEIQVINEQAENAKQALRDSVEKAEKAKEDAVLNNAIDGAAEAFGIQQEVSVARMIMAAPEAVGQSFKQAAIAYAPPLSGIMGALGAATTIVPIIKGIADIKKTRFSKSKGGGAKGGSVSAPSAAGGGSTSPAASSINPELVSDIASNNSARLGIDPSLGSNASADASNNVLGSSSNNIIFSEGQYSDFQNQIQFRENKTLIS